MAALLYHGLRREELCKLCVKDIQSRQGIVHFRVTGKRSKIRYVPIHAKALRLINDYLDLCGHRDELKRAMFRPVKNNRKKISNRDNLDKHLDPCSIYLNIIRKYGLETGINLKVNGFCVHSLRATAATNALSHEADIAKVQEWLGHKDISTTKLYDRRKTRPEDSPTFEVKY